LAGGLGGGEKDGEDVAVEGGRGVIGGRFIHAHLPLSPLPVPIHGVPARRVFVSVRGGRRRPRVAARARWEWELMMMEEEIRVACIGGVYEHITLSL